MYLCYGRLWASPRKHGSTDIAPIWWWISFDKETSAGYSDRMIYLNLRCFSLCHPENWAGKEHSTYMIWYCIIYNNLHVRILKWVSSWLWDHDTTLPIVSFILFIIPTVFKLVLIYFNVGVPGVLETKINSDTDQSIEIVRTILFK